MWLQIAQTVAPSLIGAGIGAALMGWYTHRGIQGMFTDVKNDTKVIKDKVNDALKKS